MYIQDFIREYYPVQDRIQALNNDPYKMIASEDDLPYDYIGCDEYGVLTKLVRVDDSRSISVADILSMTREECIGDPQLLDVYDIYMSQIDVEAVNITDIMESARRYKDTKRKGEKMADVLSV